MFGVALMMMPLTTNAMDALPTKWAHMVLLQITPRDKWHLQLPLLTSITQNIINNNMPTKV